MYNHILTPGNRVVHEATGERGTLISTNGSSAVVEWDSTGGKNPADILPLTDIERAPGDPDGYGINAEQLEAEIRAKHDIPDGLHLDVAAYVAESDAPHGPGAGFWTSTPAAFDDADGEPVLMQACWNEMDGAHLALSHLEDESSYIGIPAKDAIHVINALQQVMQPLVSEIIREFRDNYADRKLSDLVSTADAIGMSVPDLFKKVCPKYKDTW